MSEPYRKRTIRELALGTFFLDLGGDHRDTIFVAGSGRGGTTWLSELINHRNDHRFIFEPFYPGKVSLCEGLCGKQYLRPEDDRAAYLDVAGKILSGRARSRWFDRFNRKAVARRRLVKDIRANLLLGWMRRHFPEMPIILLLRHPCAVTDSRLRLGWRDNLDEVMSQKRLVEDYLRPFEAEILAAKDPFERSVFLWCLENYVPLRQPGSESLHIVFYERLLSEPETELASLFASPRPKDGGEFARNVIPNPPDNRRLPLPATRLRTEDAPPEDALPEGGNRMRRSSGEPGMRCESEAWRVSGWRERVGEARTKRAVEILGLFGMDRIYGEGSMPRPEGVFEVAESEE